ncbi:MAG: hypothetical protein E6J34_11360 [Chloroflexi bacterium]|nr:MAG: hypothetical protein E6J34_11360 [Chloroflexota bacterium]
MEEKTGKRWLWRILDFINPLRDPSLTVAAVLTFIEEAGQHDPWYLVIVIALVNWFAVRGVVWLVVNFTFASTFIARRSWWAIKHPRLAWRILDAIGHEEIVIGGLPTLSEALLLQDGTTIMTPALGAGGMQVIGELPAGTEVPILSLPAGPMTADMAAVNGSGIFAGLQAPNPYPAANGFMPQAGATFPPNASTQNTDAFTQSFSQRSSQEEARLRQQLAAYERLMDDWIQYTEEKWRTISDSQLGWKPLRGRWSNWDDIFNDAYAAKTSDPMAQAAQSAGEATARRFEASRDKGSAASAVASFMRDMMTLRSGLDILQAGLEARSDTSTAQPVVQQNKKPFSSFNGNNGSLMNPSGGPTSRNSLIRRPTPVFVDADTEK